MPEILPLFEALAWSLPPSRYGSSVGGGFAFISFMMAKHGKNAAMKHKPEDIWSNQESPWCLAKLEYRDLHYLIEYWKDNKLIDLEPFRTVVLHALTDRSPCAAVGVETKDPDRWYLDNDHSTEYFKRPEDSKFALKPGDKFPVRRMDAVARALKESRNQETIPPPVLQYYWSEKNRDEWIAALVEELGRTMPGK